jgi:hypothetical protein
MIVIEINPTEERLFKPGMIAARGNLVFSKTGNPIVLMLAIAIRLALLSVGIAGKSW